MPSPTAPHPAPPLRVAIVGTGGIAHAHAAAIAAQAGLTLSVAVDLDADRCAAFATTWDIPHRAASLPEAAALEAVDLVVICTPPASHFPLALAALELDLNVVLEKPPALSLAQMHTLQEAQDRSGGNVSCIFQHRFGSAAQRVRQLQDSGALGRPLVGYCNTLWFRDQPYFDVPWRGQWDIEGGGPTMGHGIHQFDLLLHLWGPWEEVTALAGKLARTTNTEDVSAAVVRFASGALVTLINSVISPRETSALRLDYEGGTLELEHLYGYSAEHWTLTPAPGHEQLPAQWEHGADVPSNHAAQYAVIAEHLLRGAPAPVTLADAYPTMELAAAIYASSILGTAITPGHIDADHPFFTRMDGHRDPWKQEQVTA